MGSKATADPRLMRVVLETLKKRRLYFLDSYVISSSVAEGLARILKIKFAKRDIFLDNSASPEYIRQQLERLKEEAQEKGVAIGIGHARPNTLAVLAKELPKLKKEGYKLVFVSEILKTY